MPVFLPGFSFLVHITNACVKICMTKGGQNVVKAKNLCHNIICL